MIHRMTWVALLVVAAAPQDAPTTVEDAVGIKKLSAQYFPELQALVEQARGLKFKAPIPAFELKPKPFEMLMTRTGNAIATDKEILDAYAKLDESQFADQWGGFYDHAKNRFCFCAEGLLKNPQLRGLPAVQRRQVVIQALRIVIAHELVHALQDQHFDTDAQIAAYRKPGPEGPAWNHDAFNAYRYVLEGEAQHVQDGVQGAKTPPADMQHTEFHGNGVILIRRVIEKGGWDAVSALWKNLPKTSEQCLHPDKATDEPTRFPVPDLKEIVKGGRWKKDHSFILGETALAFALNTMGMPFDPAHAACVGWDGDLGVRFVDADRKELSVRMTTWDDEKAAKRYEKAYQDSAGRLDDGITRTVERRGREVFVIESPDAKLATAPILKTLKALKIDYK